MENHSILFTSLMGILISLVGGQIIVLIVWLLVKLVRHGRTTKDSRLSDAKVRVQIAEEKVNAANFSLQAAQVRRQTAEEQDRAMQATIGAEETRSRLIEVRGENDDQEKTQRRVAFRQDEAEEQIQEIKNAIEVEEIRARLIRARRENDRQAPPPPWKIKRRYIRGLVVALLLFFAAMAISIYFSE